MQDISILSDQVQRVSRFLPQLKRFRGQEVMLVLCICSKPDFDKEYKTNNILEALEMGGQIPILFLDLRNECRRLYDETGRKSISENELEVLLTSEAPEIQIAIQEFDITIDEVFSFFPCWDHNR